MSKNNIKQILNSYNDENYKISYSNFWLNFSCSFRDIGFRKLVRETYNAQFNIIEILNMIKNFFQENLSSANRFSVRIANNLKLYSDVFARILDLIILLKTHECFEEYYDLDEFDVYIDNFENFSEPRTNLQQIRSLLFEKPGLAYLDYKGNFSKIF